MTDNSWVKRKRRVFCSSNHHSGGKLFASHNFWFKKSRLTMYWNKKKKSFIEHVLWIFSRTRYRLFYGNYFPRTILQSMATYKSCNYCETHVLYFVIRLFLLALFEWLHDLLDSFREQTTKMPIIYWLFMHTKHFYHWKYINILMKHCTAVLEWLTHGSWEFQCKEIFNVKKI